MIIEAREDVVSLEGTLDKNLWLLIQAAANLLLRQHVEGIIIDAGGLTGCSPEGAETFRDAMDYIERYKARIVVCSIPEKVILCIKTVPGVRSRLPIAANLEEARASLRLAQSSSAQAAGGRRPLQDILVPLLEMQPHEAAAALAGRLAKGEAQKARIHLSYVLEIPRNLPLSAPLPEEEAAAAKALEAAEKSVRQLGLNVITGVTRARDTGEEIVHQAENLHANMIVMAYASSDDPGEDSMVRVIRAVLDRAPCEVVLNKLPG